MTRTLCAILLFASVSACERPLYEPEFATRPYPMELHQPASIDVQVLRDGEKLILQNSTPRRFADFDLWINQRYTRRVDELPAGGSVTVSLWEFHDEIGDVFNAGGVFRVYQPTPVRLVEIQTGPHEMIGLITIRED